MTLNEAINHLEELLSIPNNFSCEKCREEHEQLLRWLVELRELRKNIWVEMISKNIG